MTQQYTAKALGKSHFATTKTSNADCFLIESSVDNTSISDTRNPSDLRIGLAAIKNNAESSKNMHNSAKTSIKHFDIKTYKVSQELQPILRNFGAATRFSGSIQNQNEYESKETTDDSKHRQRNRSIGFQQHNTNSAVAKRNQNYNDAEMHNKKDSVRLPSIEDSSSQHSLGQQQRESSFFHEKAYTSTNMHSRSFNKSTGPGVNEPNSRQGQRVEDGLN